MHLTNRVAPFHFILVSCSGHTKFQQSTCSLATVVHAVLTILKISYILSSCSLFWPMCLLQIRDIANLVDLLKLHKKKYHVKHIGIV